MEKNINVMSEEDFRAYMESLEDSGYISSRGVPLKCTNCESTNFEQVNEYYEGPTCVEYQCRCKNCSNIVGHYAYGLWKAF